jgi:hypothetical protein
VDRLAQRLILRTSRGSLRGLWRLAYECVAWGAAAWLRGSDRGAAVYVTRGMGAGMPLYGVSDIDLAVVVPADPGRPGRARRRILERHERLRGMLPRLVGRLLDLPLVVEASELEEISGASALTLGRAQRPDGDGAPSAGYFGVGSHRDRIRLLERPGLRGPTAHWRRVLGPRLQLPASPAGRSDLRIAAWLELQVWWRLLMQACMHPEQPSTAYLCVKLVAEPARIWLALRGQRVTTRIDALKGLIEHCPAHAAAGARALELERQLHRGPAAPMGEFLTYFVALSDRIGRDLANEARGEGVTSVALDWDPDHDELALAAGELSPLAQLMADRGQPALLPLADWRALTRAWLVHPLVRPAAPDETIAPLPFDPADLAALTAALRAGNHGPYPALRHGSLLVLASVRWPRTQLRGIHCQASDPVSFALLSRERSAGYPNVAGWSAADTAARAVTEHRAWLADPGGMRCDPGERLGMLITAARAALFEESLAEDAPQLPLTVASTLRRLALRQPRSRADLEAAEEAYRQWRSQGVIPREQPVDALRAIVTSLDPYRGLDLAATGWRTPRPETGA